MENFKRALRLSFKYKLTIVGIAFSSLMVAVLWGTNIGAVYPFVEVVLRNQSMHAWVDGKITASGETIVAIEARVQALEAQPVPLDAADRRDLDRRINAEHGRLEAERKALATYQWLEGPIKRLLPPDPFDTLIFVVVFIVLGTMVKQIFLIGNMILVARFGALLTMDLRRIVYRHLLYLDLAQHAKTNSGQLMSRLIQDVSSITAAITMLFGKTLREPLKLTVCLIGAAFISWRLLLFSLVLAPLALILMTRLASSIKRASRRCMEEMGQMYGQIGESLDGITVIRAFSTERFEQRRFQQSCRQLFHKSMRINIYNSFISPTNEILGVVVICLSLVAGGYLVLNQETHLLGIRMSDRPLSFGALMSFYAFLIGVSDPGRKLAGVFGIVQNGAAAADRVYELLDAEPTVKDPKNPKPIPNGKADLVFDRVGFHYQSDVPVVEDLNLQIRSGETVVIVGPNGCGKSTLIRLLLRLYDPQDGAIRLGGVDLHDVRQRELRQRMGVVTQQTYLFDLTVMDNIRYGSPDATDEEVIDAAKKAFAHEFIQEKLEDGYNTLVGEGGQRLSGGQRQRIALARAILRDPSVLVLDEATSQIDPESEQLIHQALAEFVKGRTSIMITHRLSTLKLADRIAVLDHGKIVDIGSHEELLGRCAVYRRLRNSELKESA